MIDPTQLMQLLQQLHQKNSQVDGVAAPPAPVAQAALPEENKGPSAFGFLGGLGDSQNTQGGVDPSWMTQMNQGIMKQLNQGNGTQPFPWQQQPASQQLGQDESGGIFKLLSYFL